MKIKFFLIAFIGLIILMAFLLSSCRITNHVVSSGFIQKRKYCNGYYVNLGSNHNRALKLQSKINGEVDSSSNPQISTRSITTSKNVNSGNILTDNPSVILASIGDNKVKTKDQICYNLSNPIKNIQESHNDKDKRISNSFQVKYINSFP